MNQARLELSASYQRSKQKDGTGLTHRVDSHSCPVSCHPGKNWPETSVREGFRQGLLRKSQ